MATNLTASPSGAAARPEVSSPVVEYVQNFARDHGIKPCEAVARIAGFTCYEQYRQARFVCRHGTPELQAAMDTKISISNAAFLARWPAEAQRDIAALDKRAIIRWVKRLRMALAQEAAQ